jgi:hypothetical protein
VNARLISSATLWNLHTAQGRRDALLDWLRQNNVDPNAVPIGKDLTIEDGPDGARVIRYHAYVLTDDGNKQIASTQSGEPLIEERTTPLDVPPPADWPVYAVPGTPGVPS